MQYRKIGHTGTLDPLATGLLPVLIGKATKLSSYLLNYDKSYSSTFKLGLDTDTGDITGNILSRRLVPILKKQDFEKVFKNFLGEIKQMPPFFSAIKYKGNPLYKLARKGLEMPSQILARTVKIYRMDFLDYSSISNELKVIVNCSKGTYIRSISKDLGEILGCGSCVLSINRLSAGPLQQKDAHNLDIIDKSTSTSVKFFLSPEYPFLKFPLLNLSKIDYQYISEKAKYPKSLVISDGIKRLYCEKRFSGIAFFKEGLLKKRIVFENQI